MRKIPLLALLLFTFLLNITKANTDSIGKATIYGNIVFEEIEGEDYRPRSIILKQTWPIVAEPYFEYKLDSNDFSFHFELKADGISEFELLLNFVPNVASTDYTIQYLKTLNNNPIGTYGNSKPKFTNLQLDNILVEQGDSIAVNIDFKKTSKHKRPTIHLLGKGSFKGNLSKRLYNVSSYNNISESSLKKRLKHADKVLNKQKQILTNIKDSISNEYYNLLWTNITYSNINTKHNAIYDKMILRDSKSIESKKLARKYYSFFDTVQFDESLLNSTAYRRFLFRYLEFKSPIRFNTFGLEELKYYHLANGTYKGAILKNYLFNKLSTDLTSSVCYHEVLPFYLDFIIMFPSSVESTILTNLYNRHNSIKIGNKAPNIILIDSLNQITYLDNLKGNLIFISSGNYYKKPHGRLKGFKEKFPNTNIIMVSLNSSVKNKYPLQWSIYDYYVSPTGLDSNLAPYLFNSDGFQCLIDTNGIIIENNLSSYSKFILNEDEIEMRIDKPKLKERVKNNIEIIFGAFAIFILLVIAILFLYKSKMNKQQRAKQLTESELKAIRAQLNPHFLFNALNSIQNFINQLNPEKANVHLSQFARLMRQTLELSNQNSITLHDEINFIKDYVELEQVRYEFKFSLKVDENIDLYNIEIPSLITQPFVENAIVHGMAELGDNGELQIHISQNKNYINFEITDNGKGLNGKTNEGFGLKGCKERINLVNSQSKHKIKLDIESPVFENKFGTRIILNIPEYY